MKVHKHPGFGRFLIALSILVAYAVISMYQFGVGHGILVAGLSWSFFVFCTPVADAGLLLDFPLRLVSGIRMLYIELGVWLLAGLLNIAALIWLPVVYERTTLLMVFHEILSTPWPYWLIIGLSAVGTFTSLIFGDDALDVATSKNHRKTLKHDEKQLILTIVIFGMTLLVYIVLLHRLQLDIKII